MVLVLSWFPSHIILSPSSFDPITLVYSDRFVEQFASERSFPRSTSLLSNLHQNSLSLDLLRCWAVCIRTLFPSIYFVVEQSASELSFPRSTSLLSSLHQNSLSLDRLRCWAVCIRTLFPSIYFFQYFLEHRWQPKIFDVSNYRRILLASPPVYSPTRV